MEKREKTDFILEQMRLCLAKHDYVRTQIISKKINAKFFQEKENEVSTAGFERDTGTPTFCYYCLGSEIALL